MTPTRRRLLPVLALLLVLGACMGKDEQALEQELSRDHGPAVLGFPTEDHKTLRVVFPSSPVVERADSARRTFARKVAAHVRDRYPGYKALDKVIIAFPTRKEMAAVAVEHVAASYTFTRAELDAPTP